MEEHPEHIAGDVITKCDQSSCNHKLFCGGYCLTKLGGAIEQSHYGGDSIKVVVRAKEYKAGPKERILIAGEKKPLVDVRDGKIFLIIPSCYRNSSGSINLQVK